MRKSTLGSQLPETSLILGRQQFTVIDEYKKVNIKLYAY